MNQTMYKESVKQISPFVGCNFDCTYCRPSFQAQLKRQKHRCKKCYDYTPHFHPERLERPPPRTNDGEFIFMCHTADFSFAPLTVGDRIANYMAKYLDRTFLLHSKNPSCFHDYDFSENVILGTTMETDRPITRAYSKAPTPLNRWMAMMQLKHPRKEITIEPILDFHLHPFIELIKEVSPEFVYVGYDTKNCKLWEPVSFQTDRLIRLLSEFTEVRQKTIRKAWWEETPKEKG